MENLPIEFSHEDRMWAHECIARLEFALQTARGSRENEAGRGLLWPPPETQLACLLLADEVLEIAESQENVLLNEAAKPVTERAIERLAAWLMEVVQSSTEGEDLEGEHLVQALTAQRAALLYTRFRNQGFRRTEGPLLRCLLATRVPSAVALGVDLLVQQPPREWSDAGVALSALMQSDRWRIRDVFPRLLDSTHPAVLAPALDLANLVVRERGVSPHPAADQFDRWLTLLGGLTQQMAAIEEDPKPFAKSVAEMQRMLFDSVSLIVSLCHYFALQGDPRAIGKLTQTLDLGHRRIKAEAAFALARLGEERALELLLQLVEDDASRPRVLAYAQELGAEDRVDPQWYSAFAQAKSNLAIWLSQPSQFSLPPQRIDLAAQKTMAWPGFEGPQECFLMSFEYTLGGMDYRNLGFSGPFSHAFPFPVASVPHDDLFGMYLANDVEDPGETCEDWDAMEPDRRQAAESLIDDLEDRGYQHIRPRLVLEFLGQMAMVANAEDARGNALQVLNSPEGEITSEPTTYATDLLVLRWKGRCALEAMGIEPNQNESGAS